MDFIRQLFEKEAQVPDWARFFNREALDQFLATVQADLESRGLPCAVDAAAGTMQLEPAGHPSQVIGLLNLAQVCHLSPRAEWPEIIERHVDIVLSVYTGGEDFVDRLGEDFHRAEPLLKVRLYGDDYPQSGIPMVYRRVAEGLVEVLVYDLPQSIATVPPEHLRAWQRSEEELLGLGLQNVLTLRPPEHSTVPLPDGGTLELLTSTEHYFGATHLLCLQNYVSPPPPGGVLVGVPNRHGLVFHRIEGMSVMTALQTLLGAVPGMFAEGPGSISPNLYWWRAGELTLLPSEVADGQINFSPPAAFMKMLDDLASRN